MAEAVILPDNDSQADDAVLLASGAAVGAAEVHEAQAGEAADAATQAAEAAAAAAETNLAAIGEAGAAAAEAGESASNARQAEGAVAMALAAQTAAIQSLVEELRASRETKPANLPSEKPKRTADKPPAERKKGFGNRYYGR